MIFNHVRRAVAAAASSWLLLLVIFTVWLATDRLVAGVMQCEAAQTCPNGEQWSAVP